MDTPTVSSTFCRKCAGFPGSSASKESTCNAGDLGSILGLGRSPEEGKDDGHDESFVRMFTEALFQIVDIVRGS